MTVKAGKGKATTTTTKTTKTKSNRVTGGGKGKGGVALSPVVKKTSQRGKRGRASDGEMPTMMLEM